MIETKSLAEKIDYLAPDGSQIRSLPAGENVSLVHCTLPAGAVSRAVVHRTVEEIWYCLSGTGEIWRRFGESESIVPLQTGVSITIPLGTRFQFRNTDREPLCILLATAPPWPGGNEAVPVEGLWKEIATS